MNVIQKLRCLELYSGIGGLHCAVQESEIPCEIILAADINTLANAIYQYNFSSTKQFTKCLTNLSADELESFKADMILMSPPCQPFTRVGKQRDIQDERSKSLLHILELLPELIKKPDYVLVENVQGFEESCCRVELLRVLKSLDYVFQEFMLTPSQFGIPNSRSRYYMIAKKKPLTFPFSNSSEIQNVLPDISGLSINDGKLCTVAPELSSYLQNDPSEYFCKFLVPPGLLKYFWVMDIVSETSKNSCCFTKRYGRMVKGAGSIIQMSNDSIDLSAYGDHQTMDTTSTEFISAVTQLQLRFFTPREIANILCFPHHFGFPHYVSTLQLYRVLGNSINVKVVAMLLKILTHGDPRISCLC